MSDFKKYDSDCLLVCHNVRLTKDAQQISDTFVKITFVLTSKNDKDEDIWIDAIPLDGAAPMAAKLLKGDTLSVSGFLTMQKWGDNDKLSHTLKFAKLSYPLELLMALKERGAGKPGGRKAGPAKSKIAPAKKAKVIINLDDNDLGSDIE